MTSFDRSINLALQKHQRAQSLFELVSIRGSRCMWSYSSTDRSKNLVLFEEIPENTTREEHHEGCNLLPLMLSWFHTPDNLYLSLFHSSDSNSDSRVLVGTCRHTRKSHKRTEPRPTRRAETVSLDCLAIAYVDLMWRGARVSCCLGVSVSVVASFGATRK